MLQEKEIPVFLHSQDIHEEHAFIASLNWCRRERDAGGGRFVHHSKAFQLSKDFQHRRPPLLKARPLKPELTIRDSSCIVGERVMDAYCDGAFWAVAIVRAWRPRRKAVVDRGKPSQRAECLQK